MYAIRSYYDMAEFTALQTPLLDQLASLHDGSAEKVERAQAGQTATPKWNPSRDVSQSVPEGRSARAISFSIWANPGRKRESLSRNR